MDGPFGQVKRHRPVVGDGVDDVGEPGVYGGLSRPGMRAHEGEYTEKTFTVTLGSKDVIEELTANQGDN